jgi:hypothetical protein
MFEALAMGDAATGGHPVNLMRADRLLVTQAIAMSHIAREQICNSGKADMWMRANVHAPVDTRRKIYRSHVIEEDERTDHPLFREWQHAPDLQASAEITATLFDYHFYHRISPVWGLPSTAFTP